MNKDLITRTIEDFWSVESKLLRAHSVKVHLEVHYDINVSIVVLNKRIKDLEMKV